jgi:SAM-dependent methyltransferase
VGDTEAKGGQGAAEAAAADQALKAKHKARWALGDYPAVATEVIAELGPVLVRACQAGPGTRVLDIAAGSGNAAIAAALTGADVVASDLTPELLETGRAHAAEAGAKLAWQQGDAEDLPYGDGEFDVAMSCVGIMFAPHHQASADEMLRVVRPGGTLGVVNWTPQGFIGQMFATMKPYAAPPPPGAQPAPLWGDPEHVRALFGDRVTDVVAERRMLRVERFRDFFKACYGPTIATYRFIGDDPERVAALDRDLADLGRRFGAADGSGAMEWEYLLLTARKAD